MVALITTAVVTVTGATTIAATTEAGSTFTHDYAPAMNTFLLIVLLVAQQWFSRKSKGRAEDIHQGIVDTQAQVEAARDNVRSLAEMTHSAASAAADAARIAADVGGAIRGAQRHAPGHHTATPED